VRVLWGLRRLREIQDTVCALSHFLRGTPLASCAVAQADFLQALKRIQPISGMRARPNRTREISATGINWSRQSSSELGSKHLVKSSWYRERGRRTSDENAGNPPPPPKANSSDCGRVARTAGGLARIGLTIGARKSRVRRSSGRAPLAIPLLAVAPKGQPVTSVRRARHLNLILGKK
jgi:hypothetical protein